MGVFALGNSTDQASLPPGSIPRPQSEVLGSLARRAQVTAWFARVPPLAPVDLPPRNSDYECSPIEPPNARRPLPRPTRVALHRLQGEASGLDKPCDIAAIPPP